MTESNKKELNDWWDLLEDQWKRAFNICYNNNGDTVENPGIKKIDQIRTLPVIRMVGPSGPNANLPFELTNVSGVAGMTDLEHVFLPHHTIKSLEEIKNCSKLISLFLNNNQIESLEPIKDLSALEQLYVQNNTIPSLKPLEKLTRLNSINASNNKINSLKGIHKGHLPTLLNFFILPNPIPLIEIRDFEAELNVECRKG
jgi:Leucine-rich repeat (LRR) protein